MYYVWRAHLKQKFDRLKIAGLLLLQQANSVLLLQHKHSEQDRNLYVR